MVRSCGRLRGAASHADRIGISCERQTQRGRESHERVIASHHPLDPNFLDLTSRALADTLTQAFGEQPSGAGARD